MHKCNSNEPEKVTLPNRCYLAYRTPQLTKICVVTSCEQFLHPKIGDDIKGLEHLFRSCRCWENLIFRHLKIVVVLHPLCKVEQKLQIFDDWSSATKFFRLRLFCQNNFFSKKIMINRVKNELNAGVKKQPTNLLYHRF